MVHLGRKINCLNVEVKRSKVKVAVRLNLAKNILLGPFCHRRTLNDGSLKSVGCYGWLSSSGQTEVKRSKVKVTTRPNVVKKLEAYGVDGYPLNFM